MKIGILGSGTVGQNLAKGFLKHGYEVMIATTHPGKLKVFKTKNTNKVSVGDFEQTSKFADIVVLCVKGTAAKNIVKKIAPSLRGKTVIDTTNPILDEAPDNGVLKFFSSINRSLMEDLQALAPQANFVKAFNSIGSSHMVNPEFREKPTMFIRGDNKEAKKQVAEIVKIFGFECEDMGRIEAARAIEPLCILWCIPGFLHNEWQHAFRLIK